MTENQFNNQAKRVCNLLKCMGLVYKQQDRPHYPSDLPARSRAQPYLVQWRIAIEASAYHLRLDDSSLMQFRYTKQSPFEASYSYLPCPLIAVSSSEYKSHLRQSGRYRKETFDDEFTLYLETCDARPHVTPIRYDADPSRYKPARHPASHIHFGLDNQIRVRTTRYWRPITFACFIARQYYPDAWEAFVRTDASKAARAHVREHLDQVEEMYLSDYCKLECSLA